MICRDVRSVKTQSTKTNPIHWLALLLLALSVFTGVAGAQDTVRVKWNPNPETDIAGYTIYLGTRSGYYSTTKTVTGSSATALSGLSAATTYYCAVQAINAAGVTSELSNEISFTTGQATNFTQWTANYGLTGTTADPSATPLHDGVSNLLKYAFNLAPTDPGPHTLTSGTGSSGLPLITIDGSTFVVEFIRRRNSGLVYAPQLSTDLAAFSAMTGTTTVSTINADWERVVVRKSTDPVATPKLFARVEVQLP